MTAICAEYECTLEAFRARMEARIQATGTWDTLCHAVRDPKVMADVSAAQGAVDSVRADLIAADPPAAPAASADAAPQPRSDTALSTLERLAFDIVSPTRHPLGGSAHHTPLASLLLYAVLALSLPALALAAMRARALLAHRCVEKEASAIGVPRTFITSHEDEYEQCEEPSHVLGFAPYPSAEVATAAPSTHGAGIPAETPAAAWAGPRGPFSAMRAMHTEQAGGEERLPLRTFF
jgi:hypothetical protein